MQYKKLGFSRLFNGRGSQQVQCNLIKNHSVLPNFSYCHRYMRLKKDQGFADIPIIGNFG